ncbi:MAG: ion transporter [Methanomicrobiales archaeon]|nr:ion transporter [Methanomicrobiales archaeon]
MIKPNFSTEMKDPGYEIFIAIVSIISIINLGILWIPGLNEDTQSLILIMNTGLTAIFLMDFIFRIMTARSKKHYFIQNWGWADLLACVPVMRFLRLFRIFKAYRIIHNLGLRNIKRHLSENRAETAIYILVLMVFLIIEFGSFFILLAEGGAEDANITNATDAIWWVYVTITTVGYGDHYPVTNTGKAIGILVMTTGVGIFATFAGYIANKLLSSKKEEEPIVQADREILEKLDLLKITIERQEAGFSDITLRLQQIEQYLGQNTRK